MSSDARERAVRVLADYDARRADNEIARAHRCAEALRAILASEPAPPAGAEVREAAEAVCERLCGGAGEAYYRKVAPGLVADIEAMRAALRGGQKGVA